VRRSVSSIQTSIRLVGLLVVIAQFGQHVERLHILGVVDEKALHARANAREELSARSALIAERSRSPNLPRRRHRMHPPRVQQLHQAVDLIVKPTVRKTQKIVDKHTSSCADR